MSIKVLVLVVLVFVDRVWLDLTLGDSSLSKWVNVVNTAD